ncbi:MAG: hypothetical protein ACLRNP_21400, partial [Blautia coccoides]
ALRGTQGRLVRKVCRDALGRLGPPSSISMRYADHTAWGGDIEDGGPFFFPKPVENRSRRAE